MRVGGWKPFWAALFATLLLLLPLAGGTVLLSRGRLRESRVQAAESQRGVAVDVPKADDRLTLLVCTAGERPGFVLLYLDASANCVNLLSVPSELRVPFGESEATLAACYAAAGPARCREALSAAFSLPEDAHYLAISPAVLQEVAAPFGSVRVSLLGALTTEQLTQAGQSAAVQELTGAQAQALLNTLPDGAMPAARAALWDAFFRQKLELLPAALPDALRKHSSALLTDLTAQDYYRLEETLEFLANNAAPVQSEPLPGEWDGSGYSVTDASRAEVQALFNISTASEQAGSGSAP